jgi:NodT family efflux transporter outer membrane factor (OMF) lipoprotein
MKAVVFISMLALAAGLAGCAVGPDYQRPPAVAGQPAAATFSDGSTNQVLWKIAEPAANAPRGEWWQMFNDAELNRLETLAATNNQNLAAAAARFEESRALVGAARSGFYPQISVGGTPNGDLTRQRTSYNQPNQGKAAGASHTYNTFTAPLYFGWELDLWGRVRRLSEGAHARFFAAADDLEAARLGVAAEVANDYFLLRALATEHSVITNTIVAYGRSLALTQDRRRGGVASDLDVAQAETQLHSTEAQLPAIRLNLVQTRNALAELCGLPAMNFTIAAGDVPTNHIPVVPSILPAELLEHRPDIASAERRMAAANADIGVAKAAFFPAVKINGLAGFQSVDAGSWFDWPSRLWAVGPNLELPLFTGGLNRAKLAMTRAAYDENVASYRQTVLGAFGDVENALAAQQLLAEEWHAENAALEAARRALVISENRYKAGLVTYLEVATAQAAALNHERTVVQLEGSRLAATVNLVKALGGGWTDANR